MNTSLLSEIENKALLLSKEEQLLLIERLVQNIRGCQPCQKREFKKELENMAADPEIHRELKEPDGKLSGKALEKVEDAVRCCLGL